MVKEELLERARIVLQQGNNVLTQIRKHNESDGYSFETVDEMLFSQFRSSGLSFLSSVFGKEGIYFDEFKVECKVASRSDVDKGLGILGAAILELEKGWLKTLKDLIAAEIFVDFLDMAKYLLDSGYKDAAAVIIGSSLEESIRQLCLNHNVDLLKNMNDKSVPKRTSDLNSELYKNTVYNLAEQKQITAWLDIRNSAAHGKYDEYDLNQVELMYEGVLSFIARVK